jgi:hypothetical protein
LRPDQTDIALVTDEGAKIAETASLKAEASSKSIHMTLSDFEDSMKVH